MAEYYIETNSFAAPFFSDSGHVYASGKTPRDAMDAMRAGYSHPCGLYAASCYSSADARNKGERPLLQWQCNQALALADATMILSHGPGDVEIDGKRTEIADPKGGRYIEQVSA